MAKTTNPRKPTKETHRASSSRKKNTNSSTKNEGQDKKAKQHPPPSWEVMKNILTCKHLQVDHHPQQLKHPKQKLRCTGSSLCSNTKVMQRPTHSLIADPSSSSSSSSSFNSNSTSPEGSAPNTDKHITAKKPAGGPSSSSSSSSKGMGLRRFSGCYECRMVVDPVLGFTRDPSLRSTIRSCPQCGDIFMKPELLELHQAIRHAVSELGAEDTSKNIVEIIFQSSWLRKQTPVCKIDRILKVHSTERTVARFEEYRKSTKAKANGVQKKHPRCIADGNELLRFHCTTLMCSLGVNSSSNLCNSIPQCNVCGIIRDGFKVGPPILTTASSGRAHDRAQVGHGGDETARAMLVCRVIAGRVKKVPIEEVDGGGCGGGGGLDQEYDSVAGVGGGYSSLDELYVYNPRAILPCFVVIYRGF